MNPDLLPSLDSVDFQRMSHVLRHRLRNTAAGIRGAVNLIDEEAGSAIPPSLREYFPLMLRECDSLCEIANRLNLFWNIPDTATELEGASTLTTHVVTELSTRFPGVEIRQQIEGDGLVTGSMALALRELLVNACEAAPHGIAGLCLRREKSFVIWTLSDSGPGMSREQRDQAFLPFYTNRPRHLGIGLALARHYSRIAGGNCVEIPNSNGATEWKVELSCPDQTNLDTTETTTERSGF